MSSAFSNCNRNYIDEVIYENHIQGDNLIEMAENMTDSALDSMTDKYAFLYRQEVSKKKKMIEIN